MKVTDKSKSIEVVYEDSKTDTFTPSSKVTEWEDCYEFEIEAGTALIVIMKSEIRTIRFIKA